MSNDALMSFGAEIRRRREGLRLTQAVLAARAELTPNFIGDVERGRRNPSLIVARSIARGLGVGVGDLLGEHAGLSPLAIEAGRLVDAIRSAKTRKATLDMLRVLAAQGRRRP